MHGLSVACLGAQAAMHKYKPLGTAQVSWQGSDKKAADGDSAVLLSRQGIAQEQRGNQRRFKQAYVNAQLAKQWAAGQAWAELDACGVPWSPGSLATAEDRWQEVQVCTTGNYARHHGILLRNCHSQRSPALQSVVRESSRGYGLCGSRIDLTDFS